MKKITAVLTALLVALSFCLAVSAETAENTTTVYVTISNAGELVMTREAVTVTDLDGDGALTINDALTAAHDAKYDGGAAAGYGAAETEYGVSMTKLWGVENGGSYGYYVNDASAMSLADPVADGDTLVAYSYADLTAWSDMYCWFEPQTVELTQGETVELTLSGSGFDADWNPVTTPVSGAELTVNGEKTGLTTDADGKVTYTADKSGELVISAVSDTQTLVPPTCVASVAAASTGLSTVWYVVIAVAAVAVIAVVVVLVVKKKK